MQKSDETRSRIMTASLELFKTQGFERTTMREVAQRAGVATGATYYYFDSKDAIVLAFYEQSARELAPLVRQAAGGAKDLASVLRTAIQVKLEYFAPNRDILRALLRNGADPKYPLSPFSNATRSIREADIKLIGDLAKGSGLKVAKDLEPYLPTAFWMFQMGIIYFWLNDESPGQVRTERVLELSAGVVGGLIGLASLPLTKPLRKPVVELFEVLMGH